MCAALAAAQAALADPSEDPVEAFLLSAAAAKGRPGAAPKLSDLQARGDEPLPFSLLPPAGAARSAAPGESLLYTWSRAGFLQDEPDPAPAAAPGIAVALREKNSSIVRESDGGLQLAGLGPLSLVGFYGFGGITRDNGYHFTGTGYSSIGGTSRVLPASLSLAGFTADPRQNIYSAEMRAEAPMQLSGQTQVVPFIGYRAVLTQQSDAGLFNALGGEGSTDSGQKSARQIPLGVGLVHTRQVDAKTRYRFKSVLGAVTSVPEGSGASGDEMGNSVTGIGSLGVELQRGTWSLEAGADLGVSSESRSETGLSINFKRAF
ncbi:hypothetical protein MUN46_006760 [Mesosutterella sp. AGMB02718]|uniref:Autotransporter outer membrane beta-barrel domain-containing protein n=1 Tax=Mesosutterella faecium TaxID=2925194 RepID=A0ABT7IP20_9BURK|nr:hypothetical protein [Mesosutterella sp. AGMB02718]MDL2059626.1 hypothetical protein [Mesosutterella sp. AGMB02718]